MSQRKSLLQHLQNIKKTSKPTVKPTTTEYLKPIKPPRKKGIKYNEEQLVFVTSDNEEE